MSLTGRPRNPGVAGTGSVVNCCFLVPQPAKQSVAPDTSPVLINWRRENPAPIRHFILQLQADRIGQMRPKGNVNRNEKGSQTASSGSEGMSWNVVQLRFIGRLNSEQLLIAFSDAGARN